MGKVLFVTALALLLHAQLGSSYILSCYFTNWAQYRPPPTIYMPNDIDPCLCTHLLYAFATMKNNELATFEWNDVELYSQFNGLKNQNGNLKTLLSVGGWNFGSSGKYEFDGLDIDWEYPANRGSPPQDQQLYSVLVEEMRAAFEKEAKQTNKARLLLSAAVSGGRDTINSAYEIPKLGQALDMINVMSYDFHGSWDPFTGECSPLYKSPFDSGDFIYFSVDYAMNYWKNHGAPAEKLMVGFPTYGNSFTLKNAANNGIGASIAGAGTPGKYTQEAGELAYFEICGFLKDGATEVWDAAQDVPYAYKGTQWVGYDNVKSFGIKGKYPLINVLKKGLNLESASCNPPATPLPAIKGSTNGGDDGGDSGSSSSGGSSSGGSSSGGSSSGGSSSGGNPGGTSGMDSDFCVGKAAGMYADPKNKNQFYNCSQGMTYFQYCATGLVFDTACSCCNWP
ncbi:unnamed protein product [Coregonus sp. 'balchen']|nr:unnamed protein product [Coregonus sp. 'balchen']